MKLSPAELSYIKDSLTAKPPIRPDSRLVSQFRPLEATTTFLPTANGSARVRTSDGGECIVGVKAKVVKTTQENELINVDIDLAGTRDDHPLPNFLSSTFEQALKTNLSTKLKLTSRFSFKLYIDALVLSNTSHPLNLLSLTIYLALMSTKLPQIISSTDDSAAEEIPVFDDDWQQSVDLYTIDNPPPLLFLLAVVGGEGDNVLVDPTEEEEAVAEGGVIMSWCNDRIMAPIRVIDLSGARNFGLNPKIMTTCSKLITECGPDIVEALNLILTMDKDHDEMNATLF